MHSRAFQVFLDRKMTVSCSLKIAANQEIDEEFSFLTTRFFLEPEKFFELVDQDAKSLAFKVLQGAGNR